MPLSATELVLSENKEYSSGAYFSWLKTDQALSLEDITQLSEKQWQPFLEQGATLGFIEGEYWFKLKLNNQTELESWLFILGNSAARSMTVWQMSNGHILLERPFGADFHPIQGRSHWNKKLNFEFQMLPNSQSSIFIRVNQSGFFSLDSKLISSSNGLEKLSKETVIDMLFLGMMLTLALYHLVLIFGKQDWFYFRYSSYIFACIFFFSFIDGYTFLFFQGNAEWVLPLSQTSLPLVVISSLFLADSFLKINNDTLVKKVIVFWVLLTVIWLLLRVALDSKLFMMVATANLALANAFIIAITALYTIKRRDRDCALFLLGYTPWLIWGILLVLGALSMISFSLSEHFNQLKLMFSLQALLLAILLSYKIRKAHQLKEIAVAQNEAKTRLLSRISHELRTPLNGILGLSNMMKGSLKSIENQRLNAMIKSCAESMVSIVNDLFEVSRLKSDDFVAKKANIVLQKFINEVWSSHLLAIENKGLEGKLILADSLPEKISIDAERLKLIISNLLDNAIKFTSHGTITLTIDTDQNMLLVSVSDTGVGITEEHLTDIFKPFNQVKTEAEVSTGVGLGLHIAFLLIQNLKGEIEVDSKLGEGTTFYFKLRFDIEENTSIDSNHDEVRSLNIYVAEDNDVNWMVLKSMLAKEGHQFERFENGKALFESYVFNYKNVDIILMDCEMPVMNGYESTRLIRKFETENSLKPVRIVAVTAHVFEENIEKITAVGMNEQINKPLQKEQLIKALSDS